MNPEIKQRWIEALPHYKQTTGALRREDRFCCLGVLCDLHSKETGTPWGEDWIGSNYGVNKNHSTLPSEVVEWSGLSEPNPVIPGVDRSLAELNDSGQTFAEIASLIKEHL